MKVILDENLPKKLRLLIGDEHSVVTMWYQGWSSFKNGALLNAAESAGFKLFIAADQELSYQQNLLGRKMALLISSTNDSDLIKLNVGKIIAAIQAATPGSYTEVTTPNE